MASKSQKNIQDTGINPWKVTALGPCVYKNELQIPCTRSQTGYPKPSRLSETEIRNLHPRLSQSRFYTPKRDDEHPYSFLFLYESPRPPPPSPGALAHV